MDIYKQATKDKVRFKTPSGLLPAENLFDLSTNVLDALAVEADEALEKLGKKSYLAKRSANSTLAQLKRDIIVDVLKTKVEEEEAATQRSEDKKHDEKILELIAEAELGDLKKKTPDELRALLRTKA